MVLNVRSSNAQKQNIRLLMEVTIEQVWRSFPFSSIIVYILCSFIFILKTNMERSNNKILSQGLH